MPPTATSDTEPPDLAFLAPRSRGGPPKAAQLVADEIRGAVARGELERGQRLPSQPELAELFDVSAPTMREALRILETEGLIVVQRGVKGGTIVQGPNLDAMSRQFGTYLQMRETTIADGYEARLALEGEAIRLLAENFDDDVERDLTAVIDDMAAAVEASGDIARVGARFHLLLLERCGSVSIAALGSLISELVILQLETSIERFPDEVVAERGGPAVNQLRKLMDLLRRGDGQAAERYWRRLLQAQLQLLRDHGVADEPLTFR